MSDALLPIYDRDIVLVKGKGAKLVDRDGRTWLDFAAGIAVNGFGHGDRKVVNAIKKQAALLIHASNLYHTEPGMELAERLVSLAFPSKAFFCNSGAEAVEGALKFSRRIGKEAGRTEFVCFENSFHGRTMGALSTTWTEKYREPFEPLVPGVRFCALNDLAAVAEVVGEKTAAVMVEPVQGEGGIRAATPEFLEGLRALCRERGALLVFDEIQCGLGRTGKMFAYEHSGVVPDILTLAKPLAGGLPMGAILVREALAPAIKVGDHGSTFGGNPVAAAAALAVLGHLTEPGFLDDLGAKGLYLLRRLRRLAKRHKKSVVDVRGLGLMLGIELRGEAGPVVAGLRERGILAVKAGTHVLRLLPPLVVKRSEMKTFLDALDEILSPEEPVHLREATERDVPSVLTLINDYAQRNLVLARTEESLRACLGDFAVAEVDDEVVGCCALSELGPGLGEIRSLAVRTNMNGRGIGRGIVEFHMARAWSRGFAEVLALTRRVSLFEKLGFHVARRERFLDKLATDCKACPLSLCCDEIAVHWLPPEALAAAREVVGTAEKSPLFHRVLPTHSVEGASS